MQAISRSGRLAHNRSPLTRWKSAKQKFVRFWIPSRVFTGGSKRPRASILATSKTLGSVKDLNAIVGGEPRWRQYGENRVAELGMSQSSAFRGLTPWSDKALESYTIELWIKPLMFHHGEVICIHDAEAIPDGRYQHTMMLEVTAQHYFTHRLSDSTSNRFRFVHRRLSATQPISATSLFARQPYRPRVWQHVAVQKEGDRQMLWIDGQLSSARQNTTSLDQEVHILVGQVYPDSVYRRFVGQVDELAIYDRCLSLKELRNLIRAAGRSVAPTQMTN